MIKDESKSILQAELPFWGQLTDSERENLMSNSRIVHYKANENVKGFGNDPGILIVQSGGLRSFLLSEDGKSITVYQLVPGSICVLSASSIFTSMSFDIHIDACMDSEVIVIPTDVITKLVSTNIYVDNYMHKKGIERLSYVIAAVERLLFASLEDRLIYFLSKTAAEHPDSKVHMTHEQIAAAIGSAREVVSRGLKRMAEAGKVELFRGGIKMHNYNIE